MMESYTTEQLNILILVGVYMFIVAGIIWKMSKPRK